MGGGKEPADGVLSGDLLAGFCLVTTAWWPVGAFRIALCDGGIFDPNEELLTQRRDC